MCQVIVEVFQLSCPSILTVAEPSLRHYFQFKYVIEN